MTARAPLTYKASGVDIDAGEALVERIRPAVNRTWRPEVIGGLGGFGGLFRVPVDRFRRPILVCGADGVGTKLKLAIEHDAHDEIGIDLVAMCVNDVIVQGAEPLFFLDYFVTPRLDVDIAARVIGGIARGCEMAGATLLGGETAEHPGMHVEGEYDLAGFCVGVVEEDRLLDGQTIAAGDAVIGLAASGPHSNGFSLIRRVLARTSHDASLPLDGRPLIEQLLVDEDPAVAYFDRLAGQGDNPLDEVPAGVVGETEDYNVTALRLGKTIRQLVDDEVLVVVEGGHHAQALDPEVLDTEPHAVVDDEREQDRFENVADDGFH